MFADIHSALRQLFHEYAGINEDEIDVAFDAPTASWIASRTRPTINCFLFDLQENTDLRQGNIQSFRGDGFGGHRMPPRRFDLRYMVSALASVVEDEHLLLSRLTVALLKYAELPTRILPKALLAMEVPTVGRLLPAGDGPRAIDVWGGLGAEPRPALLYALTAPVDLDIVTTAPLVLTRTAQYRRVAGPDEDAPVIGTRVQIGGVVRGRNGAPVKGVMVKKEGSAAEGSITNDKGQFMLRGLQLGTTALHVEHAGAAPKRVKVTIPSDSYDITLD